MKSRVLFLGMSILLMADSANFLHAQEANVSINDTGKSISQLKHAWSAQWITHPTAPTLEYGVFLFRRTFSLETQPKEFTVHVSADNRYRLYVNGSYVCMGPARGDIDHYRYETIDLAAYLKSGKNVIAAEVVNFGEHRQAALQTFQTAFILQGEQPAAAKVDTGSKQWRVYRNQAFSPIPVTFAEVHGYYAAGPGDRVEASKYPWGWKNLDFSDSGWSEPKLATVEFAAGRGFLYGSTWFLVPRSIPFLEETVKRIPKVARTKGIPAESGFLKGEKPLVIPPNTKASILLDQTHHSIGYPELTLSGGKGSRLKITYAESLFGKDWEKGHRDKIAGKEIRGYYDILLPDGGEKRVFKPLGQRTYRYIQFDIQTQSDALAILDYHGVYTAYPFKEKAKFECSEPMLERIWNASWLTLRNSATETFIDPYYEQLQYIGDTRIEALVSLYVSGDDRLMRKAIQQFDDSRLPMGLTQSRYPSYIVQVIPPFSLLWVGMVYDHYMYQSDEKFASRFLPGIRNVLEWFESKIDETGMPAGMEWWNFTDWSPGFKNGIPPGADDGHSALIALQYVLAAQHAAELFDKFGWNHEADKYLASADRVRKAVVDLCYVPERGLLAETPDKQLFSQHTQIMAVLTDTISATDQPKLMRKVLDDKSLIQSTIYFRFYLFRALQKAGLGDEYLNQLTPWRNMINQGLTTFAEKDIRPRSDCHAWSASPNFDLLHLVAGIYPAEAGFRSVVVSPNLGNLDHIRAEMPHPSGKIRVDFQRVDEHGLEGTVTLPANLSGTFRWRGKSLPLKSGTQGVKLP